MKIKKYLDRGLRKAKTDKKDSYKLAEYACDNWYKLNMTYDNEEIYDNLRFLSRQYIASIEIQVQEKVNFSNLCDLLFPGYYQLLDDNTFILGLELFKNMFKGIDENDCNRMIECFNAKIEKYRSGEIITDSAAESKKLRLVLSGRLVRVKYDINGNRTIMH